MTSGVSQGSVLGPLLFVAKTNDWMRMCKACLTSFQMTQKWVASKAAKIAIQNCSRTLISWAEEWLMEFNM